MTLLGVAQSFENPPLVGDSLSTPLNDPALAASRDQFTAHIFSCLVAIGLNESQETGVTLEDALGLAAREIDALVAAWAPGAAERPTGNKRAASIEFDEEEQQLLALFQRYRCNDSRESVWLAAALTRRCMSPNHLWQDLGLKSRAELGRLMSDWYPALAARNQNNMKWKKFFYRCLCEMEGFTLCAAPTCRECDDYYGCFGEETGDALFSGQEPRQSRADAS
jgi:nitrogen fixation protein NifQ